MHLANILDPIQDTLDPRVWHDPESDYPTLREPIRKWILYQVHQALNKASLGALFPHLEIILTGSLTTY